MSRFFTVVFIHCFRNLYGIIRDNSHRNSRPQEKIMFPNLGFFFQILTTKWGFVQISLFFSSINMNFLWKLFPTFGFSSNICDLSSTHLDSSSVVFLQFGFPENMSDVFRDKSQCFTAVFPQF